MKQTIKLALAGLLLGVVLTGCTKATSQTVDVVVTVPVVETVIVEVTREVERTVVVTATPQPTPTYESKTNAAPGTLVYALPAEPLSLDPQDADDVNSLLVAGQLYEGLFDLREDGEVTPAAATGYVASADSRTYTVTLRSGMTWTSGEAVTAQNYVDGVCRMLDPTLGNPAYYLLTEVAVLTGAGPYASGDEADCEKVGIRAAGELTLTLTLDRPAAFLPKLLAMPIFWPAPPDLGGVTGSGVVGADPDTAALPANGPYVLDEWVPNDRITLIRNTDYWDAGAVTIDRIEFRVVPSVEQQLALYEQGDLQVAEFPAAATERIQADAGFAAELHVLVQPGTSYLGLNTQVAPTDDLNVRKAIASAIDRRRIIDDVLKQPWHVPAQTLIPPGIPGYQGEDAGTGYGYDPEAARAFLAEAGYGPDNPPPPIELWYNREGNNQAIFEAIAGMLEEVGLPVRLVTSEWRYYLNALEGCNKPLVPGATRTPAECTYNLYRMGWVMDYADASSLLQVFSPASRFQYTGWAADDYVAGLAQAATEPDETVRVSNYQAAERLLLTDVAAVVPLQHYDRSLLVKAAVDFEYPPFGEPHLRYWRIGE